MDQEIEAVPGYKNSSLDAYGKNIKNNKLATILYFFFCIKLHTTFLDLMLILTINRFR